MEGIYKSNMARRREKLEHSQGSGLTIEERVAASWLLEGYSAFGVTSDEDKELIVKSWHAKIEADAKAKALRTASQRRSRAGSWGSHRTSGLFEPRSRSTGSREYVRSRESLDNTSKVSLEKTTSPLSYNVKGKGSNVDADIKRPSVLLAKTPSALSVDSQNAGDDAASGTTLVATELESK
jgi:hypothetical protein